MRILQAGEASGDSPVGAPHLLWAGWFEGPGSDGGGGSIRSLGESLIMSGLAELQGWFRLPRSFGLPCNHRSETTSPAREPASGH